MKKKIIAWDLGATKCAAAMIECDGENNHFTCKNKAVVKIRSFSSLDSLSSDLEDKLNISMQEADAICIGAAGQYDGESLHLDKSCPHSGYPYPMQFAKLAKQKNWPAFAIVHDYSPIVCATFTSYIEDQNKIKRLNKAMLNPAGRRVALGIGTGIGLKDGILFSNGDFWLGTNEMGHIGVITPPLADKITVERHEELLKFLRSSGVIAKDEPITFEKLLAGHGIVRLHSFFDQRARDKTAEEIGKLIREGCAKETLAAY